VTALSGITTVVRLVGLLGLRPRLAVAIGIACTAAALGAGLAVAATGGRTLESGAPRIHPAPWNAWKDRGVAFAHCEAHDWSPTVPPAGGTCVFGDRSSKTTVVNIGDSHGLMYSSGLIALAVKRHWRLVSLTHSGCTVADVDYQPNCDAWRENTLQRVAQEHPSLVVVSTATQTIANANRYEVLRNGQRLTRAQSEPYLVAGLVRTLRRLQRTGAMVVVIRDIAGAPNGINRCVAANLRHLSACSFVPQRPEALAFDARAAHLVPGVKLIDPLPVLCPNGLCRAVIGNTLVYRNAYHLTATFAETLVGWFARGLPALTGTRGG
jgi:SGNH domain (fused to AT3 domains)